ncbi:MAG: hypothetical protein ACXQT1_01880 [Methermicoccaceae archaeon]
MTDIDLNDPDSLMRLATSGSENEKLELLEFLEGHIDDVPNMGEYLEILASDQSKDVREIVTFMLSNYFERIENAGDILEKLSSDESIYVRMRTATTLVRNYQHIPNARELYLAMLNDPTQEVRNHLKDILSTSFGSMDSLPEPFTQTPEPEAEPMPAESEAVEEVEPVGDEPTVEDEPAPQVPIEDVELGEEVVSDIITLDEEEPLNGEAPETPQTFDATSTADEVQEGSFVESTIETSDVERVEMEDSMSEMEDNVRVLAKRVGMLADALTEEEMNAVLTGEFIEAMRGEIERIEEIKKLYSKLPL